MTQPPPEYATLGKLVSFAEIDHELSQLSAGESKVRASLMNLAVFSTHPRSLLENKKILQRLMAVQPCRGILIELNADAPDDSSYAWIDAFCRLMGGTKTVCNELLSFWLNGHMRGRIPNSVFAHLDSDLPLVFWWQGELTSVFRPRLYKRMNRLIVDSSEWADPGESYKRIMDAYEDTYKNMVPHDLEWGRIFNLRMGISKLFDEPAALAMLGEVNGLRIRYNTQHIVAAIWLLTWVSSQCRWKYVKAASGAWIFTTDDGKYVAVHLEEEKDSPTIAEVSFLTGEYSMSVTQDEPGASYKWRINLPDVEIERLLPPDPTDITELIAGQIARGGQNSVFTSHLNNFIQLWMAFEPDF